MSRDKPNGPGLHHLAQLNIGQLRHPLDHPEMAEFTNSLDEINELAEKSPGFVWRLTDETGQSSSYIQVSDDPLLAINLSVWESPRHLQDFVYKTDHRGFLRRRVEWFEPPSGTFAVCWWVPAGHRPSETEAMQRLADLDQDGPTELVFGFRPPFPAPPDG